MRGPGTLSNKIFYEIIAFLGRIIFLVFARVKIVYFHEPPRDGAFILAANHISHFDPPLIGAHFPRYTDWLSMRELFSKNWSLAFFLMLNCIPVDRFGEDRTALRACLKRLKLGRVVGIFPEGGICAGEKSAVNGATFRPGVALLAAHANVPLVPVFVLGTDRLYNAKNILPWRRAPIWMGVGAPIEPPTGLSRDAAREKLCADLVGAWIKLKDDLYERFSLTPEDLPHSPQQRMAEQ